MSSCDRTSYKVILASGARNTRHGAIVRVIAKLQGDLDFAAILEAVGLTLDLAVFVMVLLPAEGLSCRRPPGAACLAASGGAGLGGSVLTPDRANRRALSALGMPGILSPTFAA